MTRGPAPKENAVRRNIHLGAQKLSSAPQKGRELPTVLGVKTNAAKRFWKTWAASPQSAEWAETDWAELELTVKLVDAFFLGDHKLAGEIRQRTAKWGGTVEDRARLRMSIEDQNDASDEPMPAGESSESQITDADLYKLLSE